MNKSAAATASAPPLTRFRSVRAWVFDLDNTLYPAHVDIFPQVERRMRDYVERMLHTTPEEAARVQHDFNERYGATLRGLMEEYGIEPDDFLSYVHDIDHSSIPPNPRLAGLIGRLPGKRYILTNGSRAHAEKVAARLGITTEFDDIFDIAWAGHLPKPSPATYDRLLREIDVPPHEAAVFEDLLRNLLVPKDLGMATVLVAPAGTRGLFAGDWAPGEDGQEQVDFVTDDLAGFLARTLGVIGEAKR